MSCSEPGGLRFCAKCPKLGWSSLCGNLHCYLPCPTSAPPLPTPAPPLPRPCPALKERKLLLLKPQCTPQESDGGESKEREDRKEGEGGGESREGEGVFSADDLQWLSERGVIRTSHQLQLDYSNWGVGAVLRAVLPVHVREVPSAFETVGHIAHLNLREEHLEYKNLIGGLGHVMPSFTSRSNSLAMIAVS